MINPLIKLNILSFLLSHLFAFLTCLRYTLNFNLCFPERLLNLKTSLFCLFLLLTEDVQTELVFPLTTTVNDSIRSGPLLVHTRF